MTPVFADSHFFLALASADDEAHERAVDWVRSARASAITTEWVLAEVGNALSAPDNREVFLETLRSIRDQADFEIVAATTGGFERGVDLFARRPDKAWSLVDCISFVAMKDRGISDALTADRHFEQAGFVALLK